jgi:hypothetical protein
MPAVAIRIASDDHQPLSGPLRQRIDACRADLRRSLAMWHHLLRPVIVWLEHWIGEHCNHLSRRQSAAYLAPQDCERRYLALDSHEEPFHLPSTKRMGPGAPHFTQGP